MGVRLKRQWCALITEYLIEKEHTLLSTVKQSDAPDKVRKRKVASGAEVITAEEVFRRMTEKCNVVSKKKQKTDKTPSENLNLDFNEGEGDEEETTGEHYIYGQ
ncbi:uncharacterized protein LOC108917418 [Anoplophora glabripennis]|uniref:uncharacterized protein LOC108917418 n=1 Tax=Anoplophora glabripennis TaxID=217634 RepID=UPI000874561F|nr:uncharacterized protein LOC108917418 [Anoplophora glabripennis]